MLTRKDYEMLAQVMANEDREQILSELLKALKLDNARFNADRFIKKVNGGTR